MVTNNTINKKPDTNRTQHTVGYYGTAGSLAGVGPLTNGQLVIGSTGANPTSGSLTSSNSTLTITPGAGTIDLATNTSFGKSGFLAYKDATTANATGDGTTVVIAANNEVYDIAAEYNTGTYTFTAGVTGKYYLTSNAYTYNLTTSHTSYRLDIITTDRICRTHMVNPGSCYNSADNGYIGSGHFIIDLDAGDTAYTAIRVNGSTKTITIGGAAVLVCSFCGWRMV